MSLIFTEHFDEGRSKMRVTINIKQEDSLYHVTYTKEFVKATSKVAMESCDFQCDYEPTFKEVLEIVNLLKSK